MVAASRLLPASGKPKRMPVSGAASTASTISDATTATTGRRTIARAQRADGVLSGSLGGRPSPGMCSASMRLPRRPITAGSRVTVAAMTTSTVRLAASATP